MVAAVQVRCSYNWIGVATISDEFSRVAVDMKFHTHTHIHIHIFYVDIHKCVCCIVLIFNRYPHKTLLFFNSRLSLYPGVKMHESKNKKAWND